MGNASSEEITGSCPSGSTWDKNTRNCIPDWDSKDSSKTDTSSKSDSSKEVLSRYNDMFAPKYDQFKVPEKDLFTEKPNRTLPDYYTPEKKNSVEFQTDMKNYSAEVCRDMGYGVQSCVKGNINPYEPSGKVQGSVKIEW